MRKLDLLILCLLLFFSSVTGQSFQKKIGTVTMDPLEFSNGDIGIALGDGYALYDSVGNIKWSTATNNQYTIFSSQESLDKSVLLTGSNFDSPTLMSGAFIVVKKDSLGNTLWAKAYSDTSFDVWYIEGTLPLAGGLIFYGRISTHTPLQHRLAIVCRVDSSGNLVWGRLMDFGFNYPMRGMISHESEILFAGDNLILKMDTSGNVLWAKSNFPSPDHRLVSICQSPLGFYSILVAPDNGGISVINIDTAGNFISGKIYQSTFSPPIDDIAYLTDSTMVIFGNTYGDHVSLCEYALFFMDSTQNPIIASGFGLSMHCNTAFKIIPTRTGGFVASGGEPFDDEGHLIKVDNPYMIPCADTFQFTVDTFSIDFSNITVTDTPAFVQQTFTDLSTNSILYNTNYCGINGLSTIVKEEIELFPNPFTQEFVLMLNDKSLNKVSIRDFYGREIISREVGMVGEIVFNLEGQSPGIYFVTISNEDSQTIKKVIKVN